MNNCRSTAASIETLTGLRAGLLDNQAMAARSNCHFGFLPANLTRNRSNSCTVYSARRIRIQAPLKLKEVAQLGGDRTLKDLAHLGTGSPTPRRRRKATRTYTEVEEDDRWPRISLTTFRLAPASICLLAWV